MRIFLTGKIVNIDVFKENRFIEWRLEYNFSDKAFGFCKKGNNAN